MNQFGVFKTGASVIVSESESAVEFDVLRLVGLQVPDGVRAIQAGAVLGDERAANPLPLQTGIDRHRAQMPVRLWRTMRDPGTRPPEQTDEAEKSDRHQHRHHELLASPPAAGAPALSGAAAVWLFEKLHSVDRAPPRLHFHNDAEDRADNLRDQRGSR